MEAGRAFQILWMIEHLTFHTNERKIAKINFSFAGLAKSVYEPPAPQVTLAAGNRNEGFSALSVKPKLFAATEARRLSVGLSWKAFYPET
ncbi:jg12367 [Pararge aegeria aegeria]|uniref:Jg12367 protein n=1 Tax=Pararge aegeria aegeria TaxID=348720 RepID=A0A8S4SC22_9NEOP|nr:jg12367 [Pararge aegeria aegeria]